MPMNSVHLAALQGLSPAEIGALAATGALTLPNTPAADPKAGEALATATAEITTLKAAAAEHATTLAALQDKLTAAEASNTALTAQVAAFDSLKAAAVTRINFLAVALNRPKVDDKADVTGLAATEAEYAKAYAETFKPGQAAARTADTEPSEADKAKAEREDRARQNMLAAAAQFKI